MDKIKKMSFPTKSLIITFVFCLFFFCFVPITGDDWGNYLVGKQGLFRIWDNAVSMYYTWEGRFVSRLFLNFFTYHKWLWNIVNALMITLFIKYAYQMIGKPKNKIIYLCIPICLLLVNRNFFSQCYLWLAGNMTYLFPSVLAIGMLYYCYYQKKNHFSNVLACIISFIIPMFVENIGCAFVFGLLLWNGYYYYQERKVSKIGLLFLLLSSTSLIIMLMSPGSEIRMSGNKAFASLSFFEKIFNNLPNLIYYLFFANGIIPLIMTIPISYFIFTTIQRKHMKYVCTIAWNIIPVISIIQSIPKIVTLLPEINIISHRNWLMILYYLIFLGFYLYTMINLIQNKKEKIILFNIMLTSIVSMGVMLLTPTWGERVSTLFVFITIIVSVRLISEINFFQHLKLKLFVKLLFVGLLIYYVALILMSAVFDLRRTNSIKTAIENNKNEILLPANRFAVLWNYDPWEPYHLETFKRYYNIPSKTKVTLVYPTTKEYISYLKGEM